MGEDGQRPLGVGVVEPLDLAEDVGQPLGRMPLLHAAPVDGDERLAMGADCGRADLLPVGPGILAGDTGDDPTGQRAPVTVEGFEHLGQGEDPKLRVGDLLGDVVGADRRRVVEHFACKAPGRVVGGRPLEV